MKKILFMLLLIVSFNLFAESDIEVKDAQIKSTPPGMLVTAAFMKIINHSNKDLYLLKVEGDFAKTFELHTMAMDEGKMVMRPVEKILLKKKSTTELKSGGLHIMIFDVNKPIVTANDYALKLVLDSNKTISIKMRGL